MGPHEEMQEKYVSKQIVCRAVNLVGGTTVWREEDRRAFTGNLIPKSVETKQNSRLGNDVIYISYA